MTKFMYAALLVGLVGSTAVSAQTPPTCANTSSGSLCTQATNLYNDITTNITKEVNDLLDAGTKGSGSVLANAQTLVSGGTRPDLYQLYQSCVKDSASYTFCGALTPKYAAVNADITALNSAIAGLSKLQDEVNSLNTLELGATATGATGLSTLITALNNLYNDYTVLSAYNPPVQATRRSK